MAKPKPPPIEYLPIVGYAHLVALVANLRPKLGGFYIVGLDPVTNTYKVWDKQRSLRASQKSLAALQLGRPPWIFPVNSFIIFYSTQLVNPWFFVYQGGAFPV